MKKLIAVCSLGLACMCTPAEKQAAKTVAPELLDVGCILANAAWPDAQIINYCHVAEEWVPFVLNLLMKHRAAVASAKAGACAPVIVTPPPAPAK